MSLQLKLNLQFEGNLLFNGFLPETKTEGMHLYLRQGRYRVILYLSNREKQLLPSWDFPKDPEQLKRYVLDVRGLTMEIEVTEVDSDVVDALQAGQQTKNIEKFAQEIYDIVLEIYNRLVYYFRDIIKQHWVKPLSVDPHDYQSFLAECDTVWLDSNGKWRRFLVEPEIIYRTSDVRKNGVNRDMWNQIAHFIEQGKSAKMPDVLIANSLQHLSQQNGRLAVVEAVIALEAAVKQLLPTVIHRIINTPPFEEKQPTISKEQLDKLIQKVGLRLATETGLEMIKASVGLKAEDIKTITKAVDTRNNIMHNTQRKVEVSLARRYVLTIRRVIEGIQGWIEDKIPELV